jgi:hypothetical protein
LWGANDDSDFRISSKFQNGNQLWDSADVVHFRERALPLEIDPFCFEPTLNYLDERKSEPMQKGDLDFQ